MAKTDTRWRTKSSTGWLALMAGTHSTNRPCVSLGPRKNATRFRRALTGKVLAGFAVPGAKAVSDDGWPSPQRAVASGIARRVVAGAPAQARPRSSAGSAEHASDALAMSMDPLLCPYAGR